MNELTTVFGDTDFNAIAAATGAEVSAAVILPRLSINRDTGEDEKKPLPVGTYSVVQDDKVLYGKPAYFRPFINTYQYMEYFVPDNKFTNKTIFIKNFSEEAHDELGGLRCGKVSKAVFEQMSQDDQAIQKRIKCYRVLFGTVGFNSAVDVLGTKYTDICPIPCMWRMAGVNFNAPKVALNSIAKMRHHMFQHVLELDTRRDKQGSNVYYHSLVEVDLSKVVEFTQDDVITFKLFTDMIERENNYVLSKWQKAKKEVFDGDVMQELAFDDEIPL